MLRSADSSAGLLLTVQLLTTRGVKPFTFGIITAAPRVTNRWSTTTARSMPDLLRPALRAAAWWKVGARYVLLVTILMNDRWAVSAASDALLIGAVTAAYARYMRDGFQQRARWRFGSEPAAAIIRDEVTDSPRCLFAGVKQSTC